MLQAVLTTTHTGHHLLHILYIKCLVLADLCVTLRRCECVLYCSINIYNHSVNLVLQLGNPVNLAQTLRGSSRDWLTQRKGDQRVIAAKKAVESTKLSLKIAQEMFDVPISIIHDHLAGRLKCSKFGAGNLLS